MINKPKTEQIDKSIRLLIVEKDRYKELWKEAKEKLENIHCKLYSIGAPLNDNILKFNKDQLKYLLKIAEEAEL